MSAAQMHILYWIMGTLAVLYILAYFLCSWLFKDDATEHTNRDWKQL